MNRYLTKSRFTVACVCPTKLYYSGKPDLYADNSLDNDFLAALAEGGFQVGALARAYHPEGIFVDEVDVEKAAIKTRELLIQENITLFEAAFIYGDLCIRADILRKSGNHIELIEVKAKSISTSEIFTGKKGYLSEKWKSYVYDVAFQKYVLSNVYPGYRVNAFLMLVNKSQVATVDGLNQKFFLRSVNGRTRVELKGDTSPAALGHPILTKRNVDELTDSIYNGTDQLNSSPGKFVNDIYQWAAAYKSDSRLTPVITGACASCEYKPAKELLDQGFRSGFRECWVEQAGFGEKDFFKPSVLNIWRYRKKNESIAEGRYFQEQFNRNDFKQSSPKRKTPDTGWTASERQTMQVMKSRANDMSHEINFDVLKIIMCQWKFPLHMIDFESTCVAIPFNQGRRPYEQVAFQFSHHMVDKEWKVTHHGQWINTRPGYFPNFDFVRELKEQLALDDGTIFKYAAHENTVLNAIKLQLENSDEADRDELISFIKTITHSSENNTDQWSGERDMVDLLEVVLKCYYHPETNGSNSLKYVLPAVVNTSDYLKSKYSKADYGIVIPSKNFNGHQWLRTDPESGRILNPYKTLPLIHEGIDNETLDDFLVDESRGILDGGAAMTAYARMQFTEMSTNERERVTNALLRYCELDTLAMVMLYEAWREWCH